MQKKSIILLIIGCVSLFIFAIQAAIKSRTGSINFDVNRDGTYEMVLVGGNLGIGTTNPSANLHVEGNAIVENGKIGVGITNPTSTLHVSGTIGYGYETITTSKSLSDKAMAIVDTSSANLNIYLPDPSTVTGRIYQIKKINAGQTLNISGNGSLIDNVYSISLTTSSTGTPYASLISNGSKWFVLSKNSEASLNDGNIWLNSSGNGYASDPSNWLNGFAPSANTAVTFNGTNSDNVIWDLNIPVTNWTQESSYNGVVKIATVYSGSFTQLQINGNVDISGGTWTHLDNSTAQTYYMNVSVGGDFSLASGAFINANGLGFDPTYGFGSGNTTEGAGHGGSGSQNTANNTYGKVLSPTTLGSGGNSSGGGAINIAVTGSSTINGVVSAHGDDASDTTKGGGSGGSITFTSASITGSGNFGVVGGSTSTGGGGGGGHLALKLTGASSTLGDFTVSSNRLLAYGGSGTDAGGAGTIYEQHGTQSANNSGNIAIYNNTLTSSGNGAEVGPSITSVSTDLTNTGNAQLVLYSSGNLTVASNAQIGSVLLKGGDLIIGDGDLVLND